MAKLKQFTRPPKKQKSKAITAPQTASDFQEAADLEEATGGKWRAGDTAKSGRAFVRALDWYDKGLERYPSNFDLAYNKARLQLEITQQPSMVAHIGISIVSLLQQTLDSHRYALRINADNPDILFNTSQVLTTLAESMVEEGGTDGAIRLLHESLELLSSCLSRQEMMLEQERADAAQFNEQLEAESEGGVPLPVTEPQDNVDIDEVDDQDGESATIEMPVTPNDILDTTHASVATLTTLIPLVNQEALSNLGEMAQTLTEQKAPAYILQLPLEEQPQAQLVNNLDRATFVAAFADAQYQYRLIDLSTYVTRLSAFDFPEKAHHDTALSSEGEARQELATSVLSLYSGSSEIPADICWRQLTLAQEAFTKAAKIEGSAQVYLSRGDVELYRFRLVTIPQVQLSEPVRKSAATLLQNAQTYFRSAIKLSAGGDADFKAKIEARMAMSTAMRAMLYNVDAPELPQLSSVIRLSLSDFVDDGLLDVALAEPLAKQLQI